MQQRPQDLGHNCHDFKIESSRGKSHDFANSLPKVLSNHDRSFKK